MQSATNEQRGWALRYPPLAAILVGIMLAVFVLPSALNVPQTNPATTLEYAPVPPSDENAPPPGGNFGSLGLGSSGLGTGSDGGGEILAAPPPPTRGELPSQKQCVGNPPRQAEDPLAPPCVAFFEGDNGGATHTGITREEVAVVFYIQGGVSWISSRGLDSAPADTHWDLAEPGGEDKVWIRGLRAFMRYFNNRYQTYNRFVHIYIYFSKPPGQSANPEQRRADAADLYAKYKPFATIIDAEGRVEPPYMEGMAQKGTVVFSSRLFRPTGFYNSYPKLFWGYNPSTEQQAEQWASYVCQKVLPYPVSFGGNIENLGQPRKFGFLSTTDANYPDLINFSAIARQKIEQCGVEISAEGTFPRHFHVYDTDQNPPSYAIQNMANFQQNGITTVLWPGGFERQQSVAANQLSYRPEWILAGDGTSDGATATAHQDKTVWQHAWIVSNSVIEPQVTQTECYRALREADPAIPHEDAREMCSFSDYYEAVRQLFSGIQVAGPKLTPDAVDQGFHAIPQHRSSKPTVPACFYLPGDYTCVKDAQAMWWDPSGASNVSTAPGNTGCWRGADGGKRYQANQWPPGDVLTMKKANTDPCSSYGGQVSLR